MRIEDVETGIYYRKMDLADTDIIVTWRNMPSVRKRFIFRETFTRQMHENWVHTKVETGQVVQLMICDLETDRPLGSVYLRDIDSNHKKAEYGIFIGDESARGRGVGTAAARFMIRYGFETLGLNRVYLRVLADNPAAIRSYEKAGFQKEGLLRQDVFLEGEFKDVVWMAAVKGEK